MQNENQNQNIPARNFLSIIRKKLLDIIEKYTITQLLKLFLLHLLVISMTAVLVSPWLFLDSLIWMVSIKGFILPKFAFCSVLVWKFSYWRKLVACVSVASVAGSSIEGVPVDELLHHLFTENSLKFEAKKKLGFSHASFNALVRKLESIGVLIRGENNSRILNPEFSREQVADLLRGKAKVKSISPLIRVFKGGESAVKSLFEKKQSVSDSLSPAPSPFEFRRVPVQGL